MKLDDLLSGLSNSDNYDYLKIFLTKQETHPVERDFLLITRSGFCRVTVQDVGFDEEEGIIHLILKDYESGVVKKITMDITDDNFRFIFIDWGDINELVKAESTDEFVDDPELLDFDY